MDDIATPDKYLTSAKNADDTLAYYGTLVGSSDTQDSLSDLLTDLRHFCQVNGHSFDDALLSSDLHFTEETPGFAHADDEVDPDFFSAAVGDTVTFKLTDGDIRTAQVSEVTEETITFVTYGRFKWTEIVNFTQVS